jgi:hypothetical protein
MGDSRMDATNNAAADNATAASSNLRGIIDAPSHDEPYRFGRRPTVRAPFPFTEREFARLLIVRGRVQAEFSATEQATP